MRSFDVSGGLATDLYHPDAAYVAWRTGRTRTAVFDLYTRTVPFDGAWMLVAGLEPALGFIAGFRYGDDDLAYLARVRSYDPAFLDFLRSLRFTGDVDAIPEGTVAFAEEPLLRVTAPFAEALLLESGLLHFVSTSTLIATKAARVVQAAAGRPVAEFGFRRAHNPFLAARSAYVGVCASTSFLGAASEFGIPPSGTIPHALVQAYDSEEEAFAATAATFDRYTLLLDTYDQRAAAHTAVAVALRAREAHGHELAAVRLDSGDLDADARYVRDVLDGAGLRDVRIFASGDLDEFVIERLVSERAPIDAFGAGTSVAVGAASIEHGIRGGSLGAVYKLAAYESDRIKVAGEKTTWPGRKQVYRVGEYEHDVVQLEGEPPPEGATPLLRPAVRGGRAVAGAVPPLDVVRDRAAASLASLPPEYRRLTGAPAYEVRHSPALQALRERTAARFVRAPEGAR